MAAINASIPVNAINYTVSANLNSMMLFSFLIGIYTMVYGGTMYLYNFAVEWYWLSWPLVQNGDTRATTFQATLDIPVWVYLIDNVMFDLVLVVSDGLLIPEVRTIVALALTDIVLDGIISEYTTETKALLTNNIQTAGGFLSLAIIESSSIYTLGLLVYALTLSIPVFSDVMSPTLEVVYYIATLLFIVAGMAPTAMVARLALPPREVAESSDLITHISGTDSISERGNRGEECLQVGDGEQIEAMSLNQHLHGLEIPTDNEEQL
ncbi:hypothetical protein JR316_0008609 [Psilocybe cubensis]|uniref:Uncharacterized protein n=2 Tax=Psilocybe cubensis TaxID=181762 RepID=A0ACB8GRG2_PSICU|nr:hypothetical protein JR316_0008609 [Psilocybe cubensis]KAH9478156.1 hypothetical protein JR316_0008609 [Psilocybe cubensis]